MSSTENNCTSGQNIHVALVPCELTHALRIMMKLGGMLWSRKRWLVNSNETQQTIRGTSIEYIRTIWIDTSCCINNEPQEDTSPSLLRNSIWHLLKLLSCWLHTHTLTIEGVDLYSDYGCVAKERRIRQTSPLYWIYAASLPWSENSVVVYRYTVHTQSLSCEYQGIEAIDKKTHTHGPRDMPRDIRTW